jgi:hypothetical protein
MLSQNCFVKKFYNNFISKRKMYEIFDFFILFTLIMKFFHIGKITHHIYILKLEEYNMLGGKREI